MSQGSIAGGSIALSSLRAFRSLEEKADLEIAFCRGLAMHRKERPFNSAPFCLRSRKPCFKLHFVEGNTDLLMTYNSMKSDLSSCGG